MLRKRRFVRLVLFVGSLLFCSFCEAQQDLRQFEVGKAEASLASLRAAAKSDAGRDASHDVSRLGWGCFGMSSAVVGGVVGSMIAISTTQEHDHPLGTVASLAEAMAIGVTVGSTGGCLGSIVIASKGKSKIRPERFIGKSPQYIEVYSDSYKKKVRSIRRRSALVGGVLAALLTVSIVAISG